MWWYLGTLFAVICLVGIYIVIYENRLLDKYNSIEIGSKWVMVVDQSGWPLPEYAGIVTVIDKGQDSNYNPIIYCATEDKRVLKYFMDDFLQGKRI
jgi:hypothetical protein